mgnify:CR=1 FL=1
MPENKLQFRVTIDKIITVRFEGGISKAKALELAKNVEVSEALVYTPVGYKEAAEPAEKISETKS